MGEEQQLDVERELYPDVKQELHLDVEEELYRDMEDGQYFVTLPGIINSRMFTQCFVETQYKEYNQYCYGSVCTLIDDENEPITLESGQLL